MKIFQKILEVAIYFVFTAIVLGLGLMILGLLFAGIQSIYSFLI